MRRDIDCKLIANNIYCWPFPLCLVNEHTQAYTSMFSVMTGDIARQISDMSVNTHQVRRFIDSGMTIPFLQVWRALGFNLSSGASAFAGIDTIIPITFLIPFVIIHLVWSISLSLSRCHNIGLRVRRRG